MSERAATGEWKDFARDTLRDRVVLSSLGQTPSYKPNTLFTSPMYCGPVVKMIATR